MRARNSRVSRDSNVYGSEVLDKPPPLAFRFSRGKMGVSGALARDNETLSLEILSRRLHGVKGLFPSRVLVDTWQRFWGVCGNLRVRSAVSFAGGPWRGWLGSWRRLSRLRLWPSLFQCAGSCSNSRNRKVWVLFRSLHLMELKVY